MQTANSIRHDWALDEIEALYTLPLPELVFAAQTIHRAYHDPLLVQGCALLSVKTGGCAEDCAYCPQSSRYETGLPRGRLLTVEETLAAAEAAHSDGATRFCMGAAWRSAPRGAQFEQVLEMVRGVRALGLEACCTLGMLTAAQAESLAEAGLTAYNHNLDTSPEFYGKIITTRTYEDRLQTLAHVRDAGITVCCGGIIGMGEELSDRLGLLAQLAGQDPHPESVPINVLVRVEGHTARRSRAARPARARADDRHGADPHASLDRSPERRPPVALRRGAGALLPRRRKLDLHRGPAPDDR